MSGFNYKSLKIYGIIFNAKFHSIKVAGATQSRELLIMFNEACNMNEEMTIGNEAYEVKMNKSRLTRALKYLRL